MISSSTPSLSEFNPHAVPYQYRVIRNIRSDFDYSLGVHEILLSGSVGSAKSILMAHMGITHCLFNPRAVCLIGRKSLPDLKDTLIQKLLEHMEGDLVEGKDYEFNQTKSEFEFANGSKILSRSWADKRYKKLRSLELSCALIEELTENDSIEFEAFYKELRARVGRLPHVKETFILCATNPDAPSHAAYDYFIASNVKTRHVYYSVTTDNPFLPSWYIEQLKETYTKEEARRMIYGEWIEIRTEVIYYAFEEVKSVIDSYEVDPRYPVCISYDFNIGEGKPMSAVLFQYKKGIFYFFDEVVIHGSRTEDTIDEMQARGLLNYPCKYVIHGDAAGRARTTNYNRTDYDVIARALNFYNVPFEIDVPLANPPVRKRHLLVNGQLLNANGKTHVQIVRNKCKMLIKGLRLTKLKKGGSYIEDDRDEWQHITTAAGYGILRQLNNANTGNRLSTRKM